LNKLRKTIIISLIAIMILLPGLTTATAVTIQKENTEIVEEDTSLLTEIVTLYRYGLDGSVTPVEIDVEYEEGQDINDAIEEKIDQLMADDPEFQEILAKNGTNSSALARVRSRGRGFHLHLRPLIQWPVKYKLFSFLPPYVFRKLIVPIVYCKYQKDNRAITKITPLINGSKVIEMKGPHTVTCIGFYGFKWWIGRISFRGFLMRTGFRGFSLYTKVKAL